MSVPFGIAIGRGAVYGGAATVPFLGIAPASVIANEYYKHRIPPTRRQLNRYTQMISPTRPYRNELDLKKVYNSGFITGKDAAIEDFKDGEDYSPNCNPFPGIPNEPYCKGYYDAYRKYWMLASRDERYRTARVMK